MSVAVQDYFLDYCNTFTQWRELCMRCEAQNFTGSVFGNMKIAVVLKCLLQD